MPEEIVAASVSADAALTSAVENAMHDAEDIDSGSDNSTDDGTGVEEVSGTTLELSEYQKELQELGIHPPKAGQRDNRIPYSRITKIFENAKKKWSTSQEGVLKTQKDAQVALERELERHRTLEQLADKDPEQYMRMVAAVNPKFSRFLTPAEARAEKKAEKAAEQQVSTRPSPDKKFEDGTEGYSPEGFDKVLQWNEERAFNRAKEHFEKEYGSELKDLKAQRAYAAEVQERAPKVQAQIDRAESIWGKDALAENYQEIDRILKSDDNISFEAAVQAVMVPKTRATEDELRAKWLKELKEQESAAEKKPSGKGPTFEEDTTEQQGASDPITDAIWKALRGKKLVK